MEPVYGTIIKVARGMWAYQGIKFTEVDFHKFPRTGGAVVAINHTGYLDFPFAGKPADEAGHRKVRFMAKQEVFDNSKTGPIMRALRHIPVDREAGATAYQAAVDALKAGELVGVYPEATHSRSFELKGFKSGAARMAIEANVPIVPVVVWGAQQIWTKGLPKQLGRNKFRIVIGVCDPLDPVGPPDELTARLKDSMQAMLLQLQDLYGPHPQGEPWVPARLGGTAPTLEEADAMDAADLDERRRAREERQADGA
ncbi:1-acyl-sn-glycerol-3-phosphate acyltransferase [Tsukamurella tyrosinosolvens]|uniref:1-acyl-sn-glycerol-3-phosphate acyltransferases n=1 Tax=Tsukamurella tyrosinosolvens TaxID=57704 RepID=A0A1H4LAP1_TSUTY|nr:lysophospholipid acyltransferase family protein [Tsukamurella tyrosinosolvens]AUN38833.1 1-acyl-sn-glycerol-3-phosphate acyltransferase [Tsukamurella tyrosinosolvens]KXO96544.1 acyltransferase [Tsukamurella tyrosinosolvens]KXP08507.1 acyltransferase [Tsukamurella tyrosinosolvens]KZL96230.1 acyltransferase [Tsukamurella tyrosinosolvens]MCA4996076.1 1-acyl-sn-glycerol-3-phosphate acyltransferase [Tsukamurella tyrosinosolvens]